MGTSTPTKLDIQQMMYGQENIIVSATVLRAGILRLAYSDGRVYELDMRPLFTQSPLLAELARPDVFDAVALAAGGRVIEFPGELDFCADSLRVDCELQLAGITDPWSQDI